MAKIYGTGVFENERADLTPIGNEADRIFAELAARSTTIDWL